MSTLTYEDFLYSSLAAWQYYRDFLEHEKAFLAENEVFERAAAERIKPENVEKRRKDIISMGCNPDEYPFYTEAKDREYYQRQHGDTERLRREVEFLEWYQIATPEEIVSRPADEYPSLPATLFYLRLSDLNEEQFLLEYDKWCDHRRYMRKIGREDFLSEHMIGVIRDLREDIFKPMLAMEETANIIEQQKAESPGLSHEEESLLWQRSKESLDWQWNINMPLPVDMEKIKPEKQTQRSFWSRLFRR